MRSKTTLGLTLGGIVTAATLAAGCKEEQETSPPRGSYPTTAGVSTTGHAGGTASEAEAKEANATVAPSKAPGMDEVKGTVHFASTGTGLKIHAVITGLTPNGKHGFHIHEKADLSAPDLASAGGHFNPGGHKHGGPEGAERHGGDLGNLTADASGKATYDATVEGITIDDPKTGVVGKSVIIHEKADDLTTDPSGGSGARIAGGEIKSGDGGAPHVH